MTRIGEAVVDASVYYTPSLLPNKINMYSIVTASTMLAHIEHVVTETSCVHNIVEVNIVAMEMQQWVPFSLLSYKLFCTAVNNKYTYTSSAVLTA